MSVTLQTNVPLCARECFSQITMSGFNGAIPLVDSDNRVQLNAIAADDAAHASDKETFAAGPKGEAGYAKWVDDGTVHLYLTCCMECGKPYQFKFKVTNPKCDQLPSTIMIESTNKSPNPTRVAIRPTPMTSSHGATGELLQMSVKYSDQTIGGRSLPMGVVKPTWINQTMHSSNPTPCGTNIITVTLAANVPFPFNHTIRIENLKGTASPSDNETIITQVVGSTCFNSTADWNGPDGILTLTTMDVIVEDTDEAAAIDV
jgi:hypothetical protein